SAPIASAFCRTSACGKNAGAVCTPSLPSDCGKPLFWGTSCVGYSIQQDASKQVSFAETEKIVAEAFAAWTNAACEDGRRVGIVAFELPGAECAKAEYNTNSANTNLVVYRDDIWPYDASMIALTTVTFDPDTGQLKDSDMEIDAVHFTFTTNDVGAMKFDLRS